jgi:hypothetical protein
VEPEEMIRLLEKIARDEEANPTSRVTAIRALRLFPEPLPVDESLYPPDNDLPMTGPVARAGKRRKAER